MKQTAAAGIAKNCYVCLKPILRQSDLVNRVVLRCNSCGHCQTRYRTTAPNVQQYSNDYYQLTHKRWFTNKNVALHRWIISRLLSFAWQTLLDAGAGNGLFLMDLRAAFPDVQLTGVDVGREERIPGIMWQHTALRDFQSHEPYDVVVSLSVLENFPGDPEELITDIKRLLKPSGKLFLSTINSQSVLARIANICFTLGVLYPAKKVYSSENLHSFSPQSLQTFLGRSGFRVEQVHYFNQPFAAIDTGIKNRLLDLLTRFLIWLLLEAGRPFRASHLQIIQATRTS